MVGKGAIIVVFGFVLAFSTFQIKMSNNVLATSDNFTNNYMDALIHETAVSAMNMAVNKVWDQDVTADTFSLSQNHCNAQVEIGQTGPDTVRVKVVTWGQAYDPEQQNFVSKADSITAYFGFTMPYSRFFWFTNNEGNVYWTTGDTVWGPMHTNTVVKTWDSPVFYGKVTAKAGINPDPTSPHNKAEFNGGWEIGVENEVPTDFSVLQNAAVSGNGGAAVNTKCLYDKKVTFEFLADGNVIRTVQGDPPDTVKVSDIAPTGAIWSTEEVRVKGVFNGAMTIYSDDNIFIDDDLVYADNPLVNKNSDDILGLVAKNDVLVTDNAANNSDCNVQACIMAVKGSWGAENYASRPVAGVLRFTGSIVQDNRGPVGTFSYGAGIKSGFSKRYYFDERLSKMSPPNYPYLRDAMHLLSWWE
jgi:hypothetical protein